VIRLAGLFAGPFHPGNRSIRGNTFAHFAQGGVGFHRGHDHAAIQKQFGEVG
jgi:hypothetical protein